jgi:predicted nucleic acid-binding protein
VDVNEEIGRKAGYYLHEYGDSHHLELGDALIAASTALSDASLVIRNRKHYPMTDIQIVSPYERGR